MRKEQREHKSSFVVFSFLRVLVCFTLARQIWRGSYESAFFCALTLLLLYVPSWVQVRMRIELPPPLEITVLCFIFAAEILGEVNAFYIVIPLWDTVLHALSPRALRAGEAVRRGRFSAAVARVGGAASAGQLLCLSSKRGCWNGRACGSGSKVSRLSA